MKPQAEVLSENLQQASHIAARFCARHPTALPICRDILIGDVDGRIRFAATDLETAAETYIGAQVDKPFAVAVPGDKLVKLVKALDGKVSVTQDGRTLRLSDGRRTVSLAGRDAEDFPPIPAPDEKAVTFDVQAPSFRLALDRTIFSAARDDSRPVLRAVNVAYQGATVRLRSADGFRAADQEMACGRGREHDARQGNVPATPLTEVRRLIGPKDEEDVRITMDDKKVQLTLGRLSAHVITAGLIQGTYPNFDNVIPTKFQASAEFNVAFMLTEVSAACELAKEGRGIVRFELADNAVKITAKAEEIGVFETSVPAKTEGTARFALNGPYVVELLKQVGVETLTIQWAGPEPALVFETDGYRHAIMPMKVVW